MPDQKVAGAADHAPPKNLTSQIEAVQKSIRALRQQKATLDERLRTLEGEASRLFAQAGLHRKKAKFMESLNDHEVELLKDRPAS
jgi:predicted nuclease with TOPRIM domain